ncbi:Uncharacterised protein [Bacteroides uniformis]|uniref:Uncharacterized protein n=1 Tax=Bacteroides uniformis TaxID=820 RepID=A0A173WLG9_BACUN|nr:Uncharacterised protein [Bacteroides uniformis]CUO87578.1 Uncharacterised protein [Bacteroides uniformis]
MDDHCIRIYFRPTAFCDFQIYVTVKSKVLWSIKL